MSIYDFDTNTFVEDFLPPDKRLPKIFAHAKATISALQYNVDKFKTYREGNIYNAWSSVTTYAMDDLVVYEGKQYKSLSNGNTGNLPLDVSFWSLVEPYAIGADERIRYSAKKLVFEYALNKYFGATFRQPPLQSDIYIENSAFFNNSFIVGGIESNSSISYLDHSNGFIFNDYLVQPSYSFTIWVPTVIYTEHGNSDIPFLNFANTITIAGKTPRVQVY